MNPKVRELVVDNIGRKVISSKYGAGNVVSQTSNTISIVFDDAVNAITFEYPTPGKKAPFEFVYDSINSGIEKKVEDELIEILLKKIKETFPSVVTRKELGAYAYKEFFKPNRVKPISLNLLRITTELNKLVDSDKYICEEKLIHRESYIPIPSEIGKKEKLDIYLDNGDIDYNKLDEILLTFICDYIEEELPETISKQEISIFLGKKFYSRYGLNSVKMPFEFLKKIRKQLKENGIVEYKLERGVFYKIKEGSSKIKTKDDQKIEISQADKNKLINFLVSGIIKSDVSEITRATLFRIAINSFFKPKHIQPCEINQQMLEEIVKRLNLSGKDQYHLNDKTIFRDKISEEKTTETNLHTLVVNNSPISDIENKVKTELINFLCSYLLEKRVECVTKVDLANYAMKNFYKGKNYKALKMTSDLLEAIEKEVNKNQDIHYSLKGSKLQKTKDSLFPTEKKAELKTSPVVKPTTKPKIELLTNSIYVGELIKSIVVIYPKQFYTVSELKNYFINNFRKDPGNLITRKLLIQTCIELYDEDKKYYFVDGDGNTLQLWKANSPLEWQRYGLGTVYIPTIQINDKKYDVRNFTLYVYESLNKVKCVNSLTHRQENITIRTNNIAGHLVSFNAFYCSNCNKYYTTTDVIERNFPLHNYPFIRLSFSGYSGNYRRDESELMMYGYSVRADGPSESERHNLLTRLMTFDFLSKARIVAIIRDHINYNGRRANMENAVKKWQDDLDFVQNFSLSKQRTIQTNNVNFIYRGKKQ